ncbi:protein LNK1-like [Zingiber officinale]|uniref:protein LNK1-like n=1 Tax=Zingiber officinale TaxID=94328 RepID=UPI001C4BD3C9|nr:protein LNK1-like [Zingiber officinale]
MKDKSKPLCAGLSARTISGSDDNCHFVENKPTSILEIDPTECGKGHADACDKDFKQTKWINDFVDSTNLNKVRDSTIEFRNADAMPHNKDLFMVNGSHSYSTINSVQLDNKPEICADKHDDAGSDSFLDCDWDSIEHFDLEAIFRSNDTIYDIFGNDMVETSDGFLSPTEALVGSLTDFVPLPVDVHEYFLNPWESEEENDEKIISQELKGSWFYDIDNKKSPSNLFHSFVYDTQLPYQSPDSNLSLQRKASDEESVVCVGSSMDVVSNDFGSPSYLIPAIEDGFGCGADNSQKGQFSYSHCCLDGGNQNISFPGRQICTHAAVTVKPEERNVKQRPGQQIESKLEAQQKVMPHRNLKSDSYSLTSQSSLSNSRSQTTESLLGSKQTFSDLTVLEKNMPPDSPRTFNIIDDNFMADRISQFQAAISKLDNNLKLGIRDSMFRLAKSAMERHSITNRSNTSSNVEIKATVVGESEYKHRARSWVSETDTNPVDRTVAQLLLHTPSKFSSSSRIKELS